MVMEHDGNEQGWKGWKMASRGDVLCCSLLCLHKGINLEYVFYKQVYPSTPQSEAKLFSETALL